MGAWLVELLSYVIVAAAGFVAGYRAGVLHMLAEHISGCYAKRLRPLAHEDDNIGMGE